MVSDSTLLTIAPKIAAHFVAAEVRHFDASGRKEALAWLCDGIAPGDCIVVMGARDDTLTDFCHHIHAHLNRNEKSNA